MVLLRFRDVNDVGSTLPTATQTDKMTSLRQCSGSRITITHEDFGANSCINIFIKMAPVYGGGGGGCRKTASVKSITRMRGYY